MAPRKENKEILINLISLLVKSGPKGLIVNAMLSRQYKWSTGGLSLTIKQLKEKGIVVGCDCGHSHNQRVALVENIKTTEEALIVYYRGAENIPPRYKEIIKVKEVPNSDLPVRVRMLIYENAQLKKENEELKKALNEAVIGIEKADAMMNLVSRLVMRRFGK